MNFCPPQTPTSGIDRPDSEAAGKMDLLSVLLHEYGHVLGIEHSADQHNYMATTLQPGVRRLPSADEMALMAQLVGQLKDETPLSMRSTEDSAGEGGTPPSPIPVPLGAGIGLAFLGRMRSGHGSTTNGASGSSVNKVTGTTAYEVAAHTTLTNADFALTDSNGLPKDWDTQGRVTVTGGAATLFETATAQTRLSQIFTVNSTDRYLNFTLSALALDDAMIGPDDAFEVALLDANSGLSVLGSVGLTRSDALLNIQANGLERLAPGVARTINADGSRSYRIDLSGITNGTAVILSFDLIGLQTLGSQVTVRERNKATH